MPSSQHPGRHRSKVVPLVPFFPVHLHHAKQGFLLYEGTNIAVLHLYLKVRQFHTSSIRQFVITRELKKSPDLGNPCPSKLFAVLTRTKGRVPLTHRWIQEAHYHYLSKQNPDSCLQVVASSISVRWTLSGCWLTQIQWKWEGKR